jgi:hypothetical protein
MLSLREVQRAFADAVDEILSQAELDRLIGHISGDSSSARERLDIYANTVRVNRKNALRAVYQVVERLVGEDFFSYASEIFAKSYPSRSGNLDDYGVEFPDFLKSFAPAASLVYLSDVARLELLVDRLMVAEDARAVRAAAAPLAAYGIRLDRTLQLAAGNRLLKSDYPIHRIWQVNQPGFEDAGTIDLAEGGVRLLVRRDGFAVEIIDLEPAEFAFLSAFAGGRSLGAAIASACAIEPLFDAPRSLRRRLAEGTVAAPFSHFLQDDEDNRDER